MAALTQDRNTPQRDGVDFIFPVAASARIYAGDASPWTTAPALTP
jgi:hypothetical protein